MDLINQNNTNISDVCPIPVLRYSKTLSKQASLPRLPVPLLDSTLNKYLNAIKHLLTESEYENTAKIVENFRKNGEHLQRLLIERSKTTENWVSNFFFKIRCLGL